VIVKVDDFHAFLHRCARENLGNIQDIILPARAPDHQNGQLFFKRLTDETDFSLEGYRAVDPLKMLFYLFREHMLNKQYEDKTRIIAGVKACDIKGLEVLDKAMITEDWSDPSYKHWRDHTYLISSDCTDIAETCHCLLVDGTPYPQAGFDINLSRADDYYMLTVGSPKGEELMQLMKDHNLSVSEAREDTERKTQENRQQILKRLEEQNAPFKRTGTFDYLKSDDYNLWHEESKQCVGCGACTNICPTCYCLILNDESDQDVFKKVRSYDSCQYFGYARVAGGATPRPKMDQRFRNRYLCKFQYMRSNFDMIGCSGCGRCTDTCPGGIDFRKVVKDFELHTGSEAQPHSVATGEV
jgi:ferredoxin